MCSFVLSPKGFTPIVRLAADADADPTAPQDTGKEIVYSFLRHAPPSRGRKSPYSRHLAYDSHSAHLGAPTTIIVSTKASPLDGWTSAVSSVDEENRN